MIESDLKNLMLGRLTQQELIEIANSKVREETFYKLGKRNFVQVYAEHKFELKEIILFEVKDEAVKALLKEIFSDLDDLIKLQNKMATSLVSHVLPHLANHILDHQEKKWIIQRCVDVETHQRENWPGYCESPMNYDDMYRALEECEQRWPDYEFCGHNIKA